LLEALKLVKNLFFKRGEIVNGLHGGKIRTILVITAVVLFSCQWPDGSRGPYANAELSLEQLSVTCTEVWLKVGLAGVDSAGQGLLRVQLQRDDSTVSDFYFLPPDTIIRDYGLQPGRSYRYRVVRCSSTGNPSPEVTVTTLDTTSHNFTWEIDTLGIYGSYLNDVWIVDEDDIWVVGQIIVPDPDSSFDGTGRETFNVAHWNGINWDMMRAVNSDPLYSIWYFDTNNIWVSSGFPKHWDGSKWKMYHLQNMGLGEYISGENIWASSPDDIYFVGYMGSIVHYDGSNFEKLESGTDIELTDIYGYDENNIWACGEDLTDSRSVILRFDGNRWIKIYERYSDHTNSMTDEYPYSPSAYTLWMVPHTYYFWFVGGVGTYQMSQESQPDSYRLIDLFEYFDRIGYIRRIRGSANNDIFLVGDHESIHWNGYSWRRLDAVAKSNRQFRSVDIYGNFIVICGMEWGEIFSKAIIVRGYHY